MSFSTEAVAYQKDYPPLLTTESSEEAKAEPSKISWAEMVEEEMSRRGNSAMGDQNTIDPEFNASNSQAAKRDDTRAAADGDELEDGELPPKRYNNRTRARYFIF